MATFRERLEEALRERDMSPAELSRASGVTEGAISQYRSGAYKASQRSLERLSKALHVSIPWLMGADVPMNLPDGDVLQRLFSIPGVRSLPPTRKLPLVGRIACGGPALAEENVEGYVEALEEVPADFVLQCKGDSMIGARIYDGDLVYIRIQPDVEDGEIAAVLIGEEATLKRVYKIGHSRLELRAENPAFPPLRYEGEELNEIRIMGKAVYFSSMVR